MLFSVDQESKKVIATILCGGRIEKYECLISACPNPVCTCNGVYLELIPLLSRNEDASPLHPHRVNIDIEDKALVQEGSFKTPKEDLEFANLFLPALSDSDYTFLHKMRFEFKNKVTEEASVESIDASFDYYQVESDGLMYAYNDVLPYGNQLIVILDDKRCIVMDQFCLLSKCSCSDTTLSIMPIGEIGDIGSELCAFSVNYRKKQWNEFENHSSSLSAKGVESAIETQIPDFYEKLLNRHIKLKEIYVHCKKQHFKSKQPLEISEVGRNAPCPCGSGKKYKKCCLGKTK
ncbi:MAG: YecA family protein [Syntrophobacteraceae bacterium]